MAVALQSAPPLMNYEQYLAEGETNVRYDIIDGVRIVTNPTRHHQDRAASLYERFRSYQRTSGRGRTFQPPCDVLISVAPLRIRQPDVLFMSNERLTMNPPDTDPAPLNPAPELVVEVRSPTETDRMLSDKLADYCRVIVLECWIVSLPNKTVEVLQLRPEGPQSIKTYGAGETVVSLTFPDLSVPVADVFAE